MEAYLDQLPSTESPILPAITQFQRTNGQSLTIEFTTHPEQRYRLLRKDSLSEISEWLPATEILVGDGENTSMELDLVAPQFFTIQVH